MRNKATQPETERSDMDSLRREQELCLDAMSSGEFDDLSDQEWVALCERVAQQQKAAHAKAVQAALDA